MLPGLTVDVPQRVGVPGVRQSMTTLPTGLFRTAGGMFAHSLLYIAGQDALIRANRDTRSQHRNLGTPKPRNCFVKCTTAPGPAGRPRPTPAHIIRSSTRLREVLGLSTYVPPFKRRLPDPVRLVQCTLGNRTFGNLTLGDRDPGYRALTNSTLHSGADSWCSLSSARSY